MTDLGSLISTVLNHIANGRFQVSLCVIVGVASLISFFEVIEQHVRGSFNQRAMYWPVVACLLLAITAFASALSMTIATHVLPWASGLLIGVGIIGFGLHIRGIARKPGGFSKNLVANLVMGPPIFAPLLIGISGYLGLIASALVPETRTAGLPVVQLDLIHRALIIATAGTALLNGGDSFISHYKANFSRRSQWIPVIIAPIVVFVALAALHDSSTMRLILALVSLCALLAGTAGSVLHLNGIRRRTQGRGRLIYNLIYGPPPFAPLLFAATGFMGLLAAKIGQIQ
ncbi:MAG: hypothetical protein ABI321_07015 [Polyangia bacterium]